MVLSDSLLISLSSVAFLYFVFLSIKSLIRNYDFCVICVSVSLTWIGLLILFLSGEFSDGIIIALLMGQSITGLYYSLEKRVDENAKIFRLPFLLTLTFVGYYALRLSEFTVITFLFLLVMWVTFLIVYLLRYNSRIKQVAEKIIECCKNW